MTYAKKGFFIRITYLFISLCIFLINFLKKNTKNGTIILCYHGIDNSKKEKFLCQLNIIKQTHIKNNNYNINLTFDDAFLNILTNALPAAIDLQIPISIFIPTGSVGSFPSWLQNTMHPDRYQQIMSIEDIQNLKKYPLISFGSHTVDHLLLSELDEDQIRLQLRSSRAVLSQMVDIDITELALPHGNYSASVIEIAFSEGYRYIYTLEPRVNNCDTHSERQVLGRFSVSPDDWPIEFFLTINGDYAWLAPWRTFIRRFCR